MNDLLLNLAWCTLALAAVPAGLLIGATWLQAWLGGRWSMVDVAWSYGFALSVILTLALDPTEALRVARDGWSSNPVVWLGAATLAWSLRLGTHLLLRLRRHEGEDGRYQRMREVAGDAMPRRMAIFYLQQVVALVLFLLPWMSAVADGGREPAGWVHLLGLAVFVAGFFGESLADAQLAAFKREPVNHGKVCDQGLWAWTRHPNYFCEWVIWVGFALLSWTPTLRSVPGILCVVGMGHLLSNVTGVPLAEEQLLRSKGAAYAEYQRRVPRWWPRAPRRARS